MKKLDVTIYINGADATWKRIKEEYGENYCKELKERAREAEPFTTLFSEDGMIEIYVY